MLRVGDVVIVNKGKYKNDVAVIGMVTNKQYLVRSTTPMAIRERIHYGKSKVNSASGKYPTYRVSQLSVDPTGKRKKIDLNDYMTETLQLLDKVSGKTRKEIEGMYSSEDVKN